MSKIAIIEKSIDTIGRLLSIAFTSTEIKVRKKEKYVRAHRQLP